MGGNYVIVHPKYDPNNAVNEYDVAVIIMDEPVKDRQYKTDPYQLGIRSIKLNIDTNLPSSGQELEVTGRMGKHRDG